MAAVLAGGFLKALISGRAFPSNTACICCKGGGGGYKQQSAKQKSSLKKEEEENYIYKAPGRATLI